MLNKGGARSGETASLTVQSEGPQASAKEKVAHAAPLGARKDSGQKSDEHPELNKILGINNLKNSCERKEEKEEESAIVIHVLDPL